ncbi:hypothetical protein B0H63DRAFT_528208 [Podospora didyma]|uniref:Uncharacterized protein n=1 Tax=Podospora didyma TaxID=330526 RepID=A0AAE0K6G0_9PEZI|nr:hypothetical protein B0H63DRAFT_528208 [Podospora didyma]
MCYYEQYYCEGCGATMGAVRYSSSCQYIRAGENPHASNSRSSRVDARYSNHPQCLKRKSDDPDDPYNKPLCWHSHKGTMCSNRRNAAGTIHGRGTRPETHLPNTEQRRVPLTYTTLDPTQHEVRLIKPHLDYTAISYCAGDPDLTTAILFNDIPFLVFDNLAHVLDVTRDFWRKTFPAETERIL